MSAQLQIGEIHQVRVERVLSIGLHVALENGQRGLIRARELRWEDIDQPAWKERYAVNATYPAKLIGWEGERPLLSLRFAQRDPWEMAAARYRLGKIHSGVVSGFDGPFAFIDLEPGIVGRLHRSYLPEWAQQPIEEFLWLGDLVRVLVEDVSLSRREITLTMQGAERFRWPTLIKNKNSDNSQQESTPQQPITSFSFFEPPTARSILVVEDDPAQNDALCGWLRSQGHAVHSAKDQSSAESTLAQNTFEAVLSDVGLKEGDGIRLVEKMAQHFTHSRWVLMTDWATAESRDGEIRPLEQQGVQLLLKPVLPDEMQKILSEAGGPKIESAEQKLSNAGEGKRRNGSPMGTYRHAQNGKAQIEQSLEQLRSRTRASRVILFRLHAHQRQIDIAGDTGQGGLDPNAFGPLIHSPVREVLDDGATIEVADTHGAEAYVRNLTPLLRFRSCVGVSVPVNSEEKYALFLFHNAANFSSSAVVLQEAGTVAFTLASQIDHQVSLARMIEMQAISLVGNLARGLVHEVNHHLGPMVFLMPQIKSTNSRLERAIDQLLDQPASAISQSTPLPSMRWDAQKLRENLDKLGTRIDKLAQTTRLFGRITVQDVEQILRIERVVEQCLELVEDMTDRAKVQCTFEPSGSPHLTKVMESQIKQILLNLLVNSIQQIELIRPTRGGKISVKVTDGELEGTKTIVIAVEDDGPGIHRRLWGPIFGLGMTTRQGEGSGMGLFITQRLVEDLGGIVHVAESFVGWGSRFVVELPVHS